jgi:hypothetical protein
MNSPFLGKWVLTLSRKSAILQRENELLRERLSTVYGSNDPRLLNTGSSRSPSEAVVSHSPQSSRSRHETQDQEQRLEPNALQVTPAHVPIQLVPGLSDTIPRTLGGVNLEPKEIDEIFQLLDPSFLPFKTPMLMGMQIFLILRQALTVSGSANHPKFVL